MTGDGVWCAAATSRRCLAPYGDKRAGLVGTTEREPMQRVDAFECVSCHQLVCGPCSIDLPDGERQCRRCARRDKAGLETGKVGYR